MPSQSELNRKILLKLGVPAGVIETFGTANRNTRDEAVALREWAERNAASVFIIPSEIFPAFRAVGLEPMASFAMATGKADVAEHEYGQRNARLSAQFHDRWVREVLIPITLA